MLDVLIVGAGFAGGALAKALTDRKVGAVAVVEQEWGPGRHASGQNAAMLRQGVADPLIAGYIQHTKRLLQDPPSHWPKREYLQETGSLLMGPKEALEPMQKNILHAGGRCELAPPGEVSQNWPEPARALAKQHPQHSLLFSPEDGVVAIGPYLQQLLQDAQEGGAQVFYDYQVQGLQYENGYWQVSGTGPDLVARNIVNAAGAWAQDLTGLAGLGLRDLQPHRRHLYLGKSSKREGHSGPLVWDIQNEVYYRPATGHLLLSPGDETPHLAMAPTVDPQQERSLVQKLAKSFPYLGEVRVEEAWACLRTLSGTGRPLVEQATEKSGFFWLAGLGGHGVGLSWGLAQAAAKLFLGRK